MEGETNELEARNHERAWLPFLWIILACALAHLWCLGSQFYMDDMPQIRDSVVVRTGDFSKEGWLIWTTFWYYVQYRIFGMSAVGFHAVNWLLHTGVACALYAFGRDFVRDRWPSGVALFGALLFAVHPLASEIPNYARTQDLAWATLFSILGAWAMLGFLRDGGWWKAVACVVCILGATFSKGPGLFHAIIAVGAVKLAFLQAKHVRVFRQYPWQSTVAVVLGLVVFWVVGGVGKRLETLHIWSESRFIGHAYTLSRVFWEFAWRSVIPVALSSDHQVTETLIPQGTLFWNIPDKGAMWAAAGFLAFAAFSVVLAWRKPTRLFGVCLFIYIATILFRTLYAIPEFMPEYRIYPGMPWFCLGAAILLAAVWKYLFETASPRIPAIILLAVFALLSAKRSFVWHDIHTLAGDVLKRYPARARAVWELHDHDLHAKNWQAIIDRQRTVWPEVERQFVAQNQRLAPIREVPSGDFVLAMIGIFGNYARAVAHVESPAAGLRVMAQLEAHMRLMKMTPENKVNEWNHFYHDKALILEQAGKYQAAIDCLRQPEEMPDAWSSDIERLEKKLADSKPSS